MTEAPNPLKENQRLLVVIPTYNESANIISILSAVLSKTNGSVLVVDDESPDGTARIVQEAFFDHPQVHLLCRRDKPRGLGPAYVDGFLWGLAHGYELLIQMDADFSHDPEELAKLLEGSCWADLVIGSRYVPGGQTPGWGHLRRLISRGGSFYSRQVLRMGIRDLTSGFKCWHAQVLREIGLESIASSGFVFQIEMTYRCHRLGKRILEVPICFRDRTLGHSKMNAAIFIEALFKVWSIRRKGSS